MTFDIEPDHIPTKEEYEAYEAQFKFNNPYPNPNYYLETAQKKVNDLINHSTLLRSRIHCATLALERLIDGGEECRGMDSALSEVIRILEG